jgi:hypothetical protein
MNVLGLETGATGIAPARLGLLDAGDAGPVITQSAPPHFYLPRTRATIRDHTLRWI